MKIYIDKLSVLFVPAVIVYWLPCNPPYTPNLPLFQDMTLLGRFISQYNLIPKYLNCIDGSTPNNFIVNYKALPTRFYGNIVSVVFKLLCLIIEAIMFLSVFKSDSL